MKTRMRAYQVLVTVALAALCAWAILINLKGEPGASWGLPVLIVIVWIIAVVAIQYVTNLPNLLDEEESPSEDS